MNDNNQIEFIIRSNTDSISAHAIHDCFSNLIKSELEGGEIFLKALVPKLSGDMFARIGHKGPNDDGSVIEGSIGIPEIHKIGESDPLSAKYPVFVDEGTGIFGERGTIFPKNKKFMYIPPNRGYPGFLAHSKGQEGKGFMAVTYALMVASLKINGEKFKHELAARLNINKSLT